MSLTVGSLMVRIDGDSSGLTRSLTTSELALRGLTRDANGQLRDLQGRFVTAGRGMGDALGEAGRRGGGLNLSLGRIARMAGPLAGVAGQVGLMAAKLGAAVPAAAGLAAALVNIAPAAGLAATGVFAVVLASQALKLGMQGVSDAVKGAFDTKHPDKFNEALKKLSPSARAFALEVKKLAPLFKKLQQDVQEHLFKGLDSVLKGMAKTTLPVLRTGLLGAADALNLMARNVGTAATKLSKSGTLGVAISGANDGLRNLSRAPSQLVTALAQVGAAAAPAFSRLTKAAGGALDTLSQRISGAFKSGAMENAIDTAINLIGELAQVAGNIGSILGSVFSAAQVSGGGFIGTLKQITGSLATAFASPDVQAGLRALFSSMSMLAKTAAPLLGMAVRELGPVFAALGPPAKVLIKALGDGLRPIIKALGPVLLAVAQAVGKMAIALSPLLTMAGELVASLLPPLIPIIEMLGSVFAQLAPVIKKLTDALGTALTPVIAGLGEVIKSVTQQEGANFTSLLTMLLPLIPQLVPLIVQLGQSIGQILTALAPLLPKIMALAFQMETALLPVVINMLPPIILLTTALLKLATEGLTHVVIPALTRFVDFLTNLWGKIKPGYDALARFTKAVSDKFVWLYNHLVGHSVIPDLINRIVSLFAGLPGRAASALAALGSKISSRASAAGASMVRAVSSYVSRAVSSIRGLPGRAASALGGLGSRLYRSGQSLVRGFINGIRSMGSSVASAASSLVSRARDFFPFSPAKKGPFSGRGWVGYSGEAIGNALAAGMLSQQNAVMGAARSLTASARQGLGGAGSPFASLMSTPGANTVAGTGAGDQRGVMEHRIRIDVTGADGEFKQVMRKIVRVDGRGTAQTAFGGVKG